MKNLLIILALLALWPGYAFGQINQDTVNSDVPGGGGSGGGGLTESDINTPAKLREIVEPDLVDIQSEQSISNKLIDCLGNTCKPLRGTDCTAFDAATGGQYCVDTDDLIIYFCSVGEEEVCDEGGDWVAVSSAGVEDIGDLGDVTETDPQDDDVLVYDTGAYVNKASVPLADVATSADSADDLDCTDCVALGTETSGDYVGNVATTSPLSGGSAGSEGASLTLTIANAAADGSTKGAASFTANDFDASSGNISIDYTNGQAASTSTKGFLTSTDWDTFNAKLDAADLTDENIPNDITIDNAATADALSSDPTACSEGDFVTDIDADGTLTCDTPAGGGGSAITLDLGDDGGDDSTDLNEIAITGDTNSIFGEPTADKLLIAVGNNWPTADEADALSVDPSDCAAGEFATTIAANGDLTCAEPDWSDLVNVPVFRGPIADLRPQSYEPPSSSFATLFSRNGHPGLAFDGDVCAAWTFVMPNTYGGNGVTVDIWVVSSETSNDTDWDGSWERIDTAQDIDSDSYASAVSADNNNNNGTSGIPTQVTFTFTNGAQMDSCDAGELCRFRLCRDATGDTGGTTNGQAVMIGGQIRETPDA